MARPEGNVAPERTLAMRDGKRSLGTGTDRDMRSRASSSTDTPPSTDTVGLAPRTNPSKRRCTRGGVSESGGSSSPDTSKWLGGLLFGVPAEVAALTIKHCQPCDFAALCSARHMQSAAKSHGWHLCWQHLCRALHPLIEQELILRSRTLSPIPTLAAASGDEQRILFAQLCNVLEPRAAVYFSSVNRDLRTATQKLLLQLRADHELATALCLKLGMQSCKELREAKKVQLRDKVLNAAELALLGTLGSVLPALETLSLQEPVRASSMPLEPASGPDGVQRMAAGLGAGALPALTHLDFYSAHVGEAGASALAAALGRGALPRLEELDLCSTAIGDAGLLALAPALRRLPALEWLWLSGNPIGDEGLAALVAPPPAAGALSPPTGGLAKLKLLGLDHTQISDAGCGTLAAAIDSDALPAFQNISFYGIPASAAAKAAVKEALAALIHDREPASIAS